MSITAGGQGNSAGTTLIGFNGGTGTLNLGSFWATDAGATFISAGPIYVGGTDYTVRQEKLNTSEIKHGPQPHIREPEDQRISIRGDSN